MNSQYIKQIVEQLVLATGQPVVAQKAKVDLVEQSNTYTAKDIDRFIEALSNSARLSDLTIIVNSCPVDQFDELINSSAYPVLYFEQLNIGLTPIIGGSDFQGQKIAWSPVITYEPSEQISCKDPLLFRNHPDPSKNGQVVYITTFPMQPLVSDDSSLRQAEKEDLSPLQRLTRLLRNERKDIGYIYFYAVVVGLISLILPLGVQAIFSLVSSGSIFSSVYVLMGLVVLGLIGSGIMQIIQVTLVETLQMRIFAKAAFEFTYRVPRLNSEGLSQDNPTELMNRFFDVLTVQKALPKFLIDLTGAVLQIVFGLLLLSFYHPFFIAFSFFVIFVFFTIVRLNGRKGLETSIKESKYKYRVVAWLEGMAGTLFSFKTAGATNLPIQRMDGLVTNYLTYRTKHFKILQGFYYYALIFKVLVIGGLLVLGTYLLVNRQISLGQFVASEIVIVLLTGAVEKLFLSIDVVFDLLTAVDKLGYVSDLPLEKDGGLTFKTPKEEMALKAHNLSYTYAGAAKAALKNINLDVKAGERICITGQNGSGKHTLLKVLSGILSSYEGSVMYNGISLRDLDMNLLRTHVSMNFPNQEIFDGTILENLTMGRGGITLEQLQEVLDKLNLTDEISSLPEGLSTPIISGGRRFSLSFVTKIALARCLLTQPKLMLYTDALREIERNERLRIIDLLTDSSNNWTLLVLSNEPEFMGACDRVIVMNEGEIIAEGPYKSVLKHLSLPEK
ncbi:peptidase domain-containing ABC transporter [Runella salmonicolor]|uniref:ABC transporter ATP-binding protein/permease n=1 Tax=Runella salmonicolor TaxID=2950278 RepID=A0ABT1FL72_9BACT|nr:ABC transporter ATP-binding protein [Runella salmonicolor]MCP1382514.1 ABC transporter ATP-binding protein/permease [Runella salmonicolor]